MDDQAAKNQATLVHTFKGLEPTIFAGLNLRLKEEILALTQKEIALLAESGGVGASQHLEKILKPLINGEEIFTKEEVEEVSSLIEYGKPKNILTKGELDTVKNQEIQQEFSHFSRIMGLDYILQGTCNLSTPEDAFEYCKDFARFISLLHDRRVHRGIEEPFPNDYYNAEFEGNLSIFNHGGFVRKNHTVNIGALVALGGLTFKEEEIKLLLSTYERFLCRFPFEIANYLLDLYVFLTRPKSDYEFIAVKEVIKKRRRYAYHWQVGTGAFIYLSPTKENYYRKQVRFRPKKLTKSSLGRFLGNIHYREIYELSSQESVFLLSAKQLEAFGNIGSAFLNQLLNRPDSSGKIFPVNNLRNYLAKQKLETEVGLLKLNRAKEPKEIDWTGIRVPKNEVWQRILKSEGVILEAAHIHADQKTATQAQEISATLGGNLSKEIKDAGYFGQLRKVLMVDEYHVPNRLDYRHYLNIVASRGHAVEEVIFESSPLIKLISYGVLNRLVRQKSHVYQTKFQGNNFYFQLIGDPNGVIELVQDVKDSFTSSCILFDAAFTIYKYIPDLCNDIYYETLPPKLKNQLSGKTLHQRMLEIYESSEKTDERDKAIKLFNPPKPVTKLIFEGKPESPFFEVLEHLPDNLVAVNVLESFYQPQQVKLNKLLKCLGIPSVARLIFNPANGEVELED